MSFKPLIFLALMLGAASAGAHAKIYTYLDSDGVRHYTDVPDDNRYKLLALSSHDITQSGDHYDPTVLARATQYESAARGHRGGVGVQFARGLQEGGSGPHAAHAGHGHAFRRLESLRSDAKYPRRRRVLEVFDGSLRP
jgi:hypothetical protein